MLCIRTNIVQSMGRRYVAIKPGSKQIIQHTKHAKQVNDMHVPIVLRKISNHFRDGQMIPTLFFDIPKKGYGHNSPTNVKTQPT